MKNCSNKQTLESSFLIDKSVMKESVSFEKVFEVSEKAENEKLFEDYLNNEERKYFRFPYRFISYLNPGAYRVCEKIHKFESNKNSRKRGKDFYVDVFLPTEEVYKKYGKIKKGVDYKEEWNRIYDENPYFGRSIETYKDQTKWCLNCTFGKKTFRLKVNFVSLEDLEKGKFDFFICSKDDFKYRFGYCDLLCNEKNWEKKQKNRQRMKRRAIFFSSLKIYKKKISEFDISELLNFQDLFLVENINHQMYGWYTKYLKGFYTKKNIEKLEDEKEKNWIKKAKKLDKFTVLKGIMDFLEVSPEKENPLVKNLCSLLKETYTYGIKKMLVENSCVEEVVREKFVLNKTVIQPTQHPYNTRKKKDSLVFQSKDFNQNKEKKDLFVTEKISNKYNQDIKNETGLKIGDEFCKILEDLSIDLVTLKNIEKMYDSEAMKKPFEKKGGENSNNFPVLVRGHFIVKFLRKFTKEVLKKTKAEIEIYGDGDVFRKVSNPTIINYRGIKFEIQPDFFIDACKKNQKNEIVSYSILQSENKLTLAEAVKEDLPKMILSAHQALRERISYHKNEKEAEDDFIIIELNGLEEQKSNLYLFQLSKIKEIRESDFDDIRNNNNDEDYEKSDQEEYLPSDNDSDNEENKIIGFQPEKYTLTTIFKEHSTKDDYFNYEATILLLCLKNISRILNSQKK